MQCRVRSMLPLSIPFLGSFFVIQNNILTTFIIRYSISLQYQKFFTSHISTLYFFPILHTTRYTISIVLCFVNELKYLILHKRVQCFVLHALGHHCNKYNGLPSPVQPVVSCRKNEWQVCICLVFLCLDYHSTNIYTQKQKTP